MTQQVKITISGDSSPLDASLKKAKNSLSNFASSAGKLEGSLTKIAAIGATVGTVIGSVVSRAFSSLSGAMDGAVSRLDTLNNFPRVMSNLAIGTEQSQKVIDLLSDKLIGLPTTLDTAALAVQRFTAANGDIEASTAIYLALNDALLAGGTSAEAQAGAMEQLAQAYGKGKPDAMEWRKMLETMPAQLKQVATSLGYTSTAIGGDLQTALTNGTLSMNEFMAEFVKLDKEGLAGFQSFRDQAFNSSNGVQTALVNLKNAFVRMFADIMNAIGQSNIAGFFNNLRDRIVNVTKYVVAFTKVMAQAFAYVRALFGMFGGVKKNAEGTASAISSAGAGIGGVADGAKDTAGGLKDANKQAKKLAQQLAGFDEMTVLKEPDTSSSSGSGGGGGGVADMGDVSGIDTSVFDNISGSVDEMVEKIAAKLEWLRPIFEKVFTAAFNAVQHIKEALAQVDWHTFAEIVGNVITFIIGLIEGMVVTWINFYNKIAPILKKVTDWLAKHAVAIGKVVAVLGILKTALKVLSPLIKGIKTAFAVWTTAKDIIGGLITKLGGLSNIFETLKLAFTHPFESLQGVVLKAKDLVTGFFAVVKAHPFVAIAAAIAALALANEDFRNALGNLLNAVLTPLSKLLGTIQDVLGTLFSTLGTILNAVLEPIIGVINIIAEVLAIVFDVLGEIIGLGLEIVLQPIVMILQILQPLLELIGNIIKAILAPIEALVGWLGGLFGITNENTEATKEHTQALSDEQKQFDKNGDGALDYAENLSYLRSVIDGTNKAEADLIQAQKEQVKKYQELDQYCQKYNKTADELIELHRKGELKTLDAGDALDELTMAVIDVESANYKVISATDKFNDEQGKLQSAANQTKEKLDEAGEELLKLGEQGIDSGEKWNELTGKIQEYGQQIKETGKNVGEIRNWEGDARAAAENVVRGAIQGVWNQTPAFVNANKNLAIQGMNAFNNQYKIKSPSRVMRQAGEYIGEGAILGVEDTYGDFADALSGLAEVGQDAFDQLQLEDYFQEGLEIPVVAKVDDSELSNFNTGSLGKVIANEINNNDEVAIGGGENHLTIKIGEDTLLDRVIDGINGKSEQRNRSVIRV